LGWEVKVDSELILIGKQYSVSVEKTKDGYKFKIDDEQADFMPIDFETNCFKLNINGTVKTVYVATDKKKGQSYAHIDGMVLPIQAVTEELEEGMSSAEEIIDGKQLIHAPMPGKIVKIAVEEGQEVKEKQLLCVVEAMKMENEIRAKFEGVVKEVNNKDGDLVGTEETILIVEKIE